jgi:hypothetical protein
LVDYDTIHEQELRLNLNIENKRNKPNVELHMLK